MDMAFLRAGLAMSTGSGAVYSLHSHVSREDVARNASLWGASSQVLAELRFELPRTRPSRSQTIDVDFWRICPNVERRRDHGLQEENPEDTRFPTLLTQSASSRAPSPGVGARAARRRGRRRLRGLATRAAGMTLASP